MWKLTISGLLSKSYFFKCPRGQLPQLLELQRLAPRPVVTRCIDPNLCYNDLPPLPPDFTVEWNQTLSKPNVVNTTISYRCVGKCKKTFRLFLLTFAWLFESMIFLIFRIFIRIASCLQMNARPRALDSYILLTILSMQLPR